MSNTNLSKFWNDHEISSIWFISSVHPAGKELIHNTDAADPEDYCDLSDAVGFLGDLDQLTGNVLDNGTWEWDGNSGDPKDWTNSTILNLKVFAK